MWEAKVVACFWPPSPRKGFISAIFIRADSDTGRTLLTVTGFPSGVFLCVQGLILQILVEPHTIVISLTFVGQSSFGASRLGVVPSVTSTSTGLSSPMVIHVTSWRMPSSSSKIFSGAFTLEGIGGSCCERCGADLMIGDGVRAYGHLSHVTYTSQFVTQMLFSWRSSSAALTCSVTNSDK